LTTCLTERLFDKLNITNNHRLTADVLKTAIKVWYRTLRKVKCRHLDRKKVCIWTFCLRTCKWQYFYFRFESCCHYRSTASLLHTVDQLMTITNWRHISFTSTQCHMVLRTHVITTVSITSPFLAVTSRIASYYSQQSYLVAMRRKGSVWGTR